MNIGKILRNRFFLSTTTFIFLYITYVHSDYIVLITLAPAIAMAFLEKPKNALLPSLIVALSPFAFFSWGVPGQKQIYFFFSTIYAIFLFVSLIIISAVSKNKIIKKKSWMFVLIPPAIYAACIYPSSFTVFGDAWLNLGLFFNPPLISHYIGISGLIIVIVLFNSILGGLITKPSKRLLIASGLLALIFIGTYLGGELNNHSKDRRHVRIALLQGDFEKNFSWRQSMIDPIFDTYRNMSIDAARSGVDLIVWPENSIIVDQDNEERYDESLRNLSRDLGTVLVVGKGLISNVNVNRKEYNSAQVIFPDGNVRRYFATNPYPGSGAEQGKGIGVIKAPFGSFGIIICYEELFDESYHKYKDDDADFIVSIANNGMVDDSGKRIIGKFSAVFSNRYSIPLARATNSGETKVYDSNGQTIAKLGSDTKSVLLAEIPLDK